MTSAFFLHKVWSYQPHGWGFLCVRRKDHGWVSLSVETLADGFREHMISGYVGYGHDVYFCPTTFKERHRRTENANHGRWLFADLDEAPIDNLPLRPTLLWRTSRDRHQALWLLDQAVEPEELQDINRRLTFAIGATLRGIGGADASGWDLTQLLRVPGTKNFKRDDPEEVVLL